MKISEVVSNNFWMKILSLIIGTAIYFYVHVLIQTTTEITMKVRVSVEESLRVKSESNQPGQKYELEAAAESQNLTVMAKVSGPTNQIRLLKGEPPSLEIVVGEKGGELSAGVVSVKLDESQLKQFPADVKRSDLKFDFVDSQYLDIKIQEIVEKKVVVKVDYDFSDSTKVNVKGVKYHNPSSVTVRGPREVVEKMEFVKTKRITNIIQEVTQTDIKNVALVDSVEDTPITCTPSSLELVRLLVSDWDEKVELTNVPIRCMASKDGKIVKFPNEDESYVTLTITGPPKLEDGTELHKITMDSFLVFVYVEIDDNKKVKRRVRVWTDLKGIKVEVKPENVVVIVNPK